MRSDGNRLAEVARGHLPMEAPACPGWTVADVVNHVAQVYEHKIACTQGQREPDPWPPAWPPERDPLEWFADAHLRLLTLFRELGPEAPSFTWWPPDQTVGFWGRRMAQETVIHRIDVELSCGGAGAVDRHLAVDGVDEVLNIFLAGDWSDEPVAELAAQRIVIRTGGCAWEVELLSDEVKVGDPDGSADAELEGSPEALLLWLWGRGAANELTCRGEASILTPLRSRLALATQ